MGERRRAEEERQEVWAAAPVLVGLGAKPSSPPGSAATASAVGTSESCCAPAGSNPAAGRSSEGGRFSTVLAGLRGLDLSQIGRDVAREGWRLGGWLLVAFALEAVILLYVPQEAIAGVLGGSNPLAVPLAALVGLPLYLNEAGALPIVAGLLEGGMSPGAAIAFLIAGPATTVPAMAAVWALVRPRVFALYAGVALVGAVTLGLLTDLVL
jgi:uncharacterized protein